MIPVLETRGAPFDRGVVQGTAHRRAISEWLDREVRPLGWIGALETRYVVHRGPGRALQRFLLQEHERLRGIALGAGLSSGLLELAEMNVRVGGVGSARGGELEARLDVPASLLAMLLLRRSVPDAVGFESVELGATPWTGCLAGVNRWGIGVVVLEDRRIDQVSLRSFAQDFLLRASDLSAGLRHLALRVRYARGSGVLLVADAQGRAVRAELCGETMRTSDVAPRGFEVAESTVRLDLAERALEVRLPDGSAQRLAIESRPEDRAATTER